ncbi:hypothetical protein C2W62_26870 [Candidatus Entotheonella serta]|nr:hypothetical protein C2W62_26870 [Candidatus Entotheonella serta]
MSSVPNPRTALLAVLLAALIAIFSVVLAPGSALTEPDAIAIERLIQDATGTTGVTPVKRIQAVKALGNSGDLRALSPLLGLLDDVDPSIRKHAIEALQMLTQRLKQIYTHLAQWIDNLLLRLDIYLAPEPPIERTQHQRII